MSKTLTKYRAALQVMDRSQLLTEFNHVMDQIEQVRAGERVEVDWPWDGAERRKEYKHSVGPAVEPAPVKYGKKYRPDGSAYYPLYGETK